MKIPNSQSGVQHAQSGSATLVMLALLGIMVTFVAVNTVSVRTLQRELKLIEQKQVQRLQGTTEQQKASRSQSVAVAHEVKDSATHD